MGLYTLIYTAPTRLGLSGAHPGMPGTACAGASADTARDDTPLDAPRSRCARFIRCRCPQGCACAHPAPLSRRRTTPLGAPCRVFDPGPPGSWVPDQGGLSACGTSHSPEQRPQGLAPPTCVGSTHPRCQERLDPMSFHGFLVPFKARCLPLCGERGLPPTHDTPALWLPSRASRFTTSRPTLRSKLRGGASVQQSRWSLPSDPGEQHATHLI